MRRLLYTLCAFLLISCDTSPQPRLNAEVLPRPTKTTHLEGMYCIDRSTTLCYNEEVAKIADILCEYVPITKRTTECCDENTVRLLVDNSLGKEAYTLTINDTGVTIKGGDYGGVFYGVQSLLQLLPYEVFTKKARLPLAVQHIEIEDSPRFPYRGMLMDLENNSYSMEEIKALLDIYAMHKLNYCLFLMQSTNNWRLEIKSHPELVAKGAYSGGDTNIRPNRNCPNEKWGCFYTQEEMREIIAYAADRNIEIIPEVSGPGHSHIMGRIHPEILCNYTPDLSKSNGYDCRNAWCVAKEENYKLLDDIIHEIAELFPSKYIHLGGDEVNFKVWEPCPDCQALAKKLGIKVGPQLQDIFSERVRQIAKRYGKIPAIYDEAIDGGELSKETIVYAWRNIDWARKTSERGYPTIVMPGESFYFDTKQSDSEVGHHWSFAFDAKHIVEWEFEKLGFSEQQQSHIIGLQAAYWGGGRNNWEHHFTDGYKPNLRNNISYYNYMSFPRLSAYAETSWSHNKRNWEEFSSFMKNSFGHTLSTLGLEYRLETPIVKVEGDKLSASVSDGSTLYYEDIRTGKSKLYRTPLSADDAEYTLFYSRHEMGLSKKVGAEAYYAELSPKYELTSSFDFTYGDMHPVKEHYKWRANRGARKGDWVLYTFEEPLSCYSILVQAGYTHTLGWFIFDADVEISYDGKRFEKAEKLWYGSATLHPTKPVHAVRLVVNADMPVEYTVIQPLVVK